MPFAIGGNQLDTGYEVSNSLRFNDDDSPNVSNNPGGGSGSDGSRTQFSISMWVKRSRVSGTQQFLTSAVATNNFYGSIKFNSDNKIQINLINSGSDQDEIVTNAVFRDVSAWYHLFFVFDKTQASISNGVKLYVNGVLQTFGTTTYTQNQGYHFFRPGKTHYIGNFNGSEGYFDGYMAEIHFVDGQLKAHTDFGETNDNGVWIPKEYDGTHGTYGFYLEFKQTGTSEDSSGIGADTSGNDEHFAVANLAATDITTDTPTNNFCTLNPLSAGSDMRANGSFKEGNCELVNGDTTGESNGQKCSGTMGFANGKWYWEVKLISNTMTAGIVDSSISTTSDINLGSKNAVTYDSETGAINNISGAVQGETVSSQYDDDDIIGVAVDADNGAVYFAKNNTYQNSGNPTSGASKTGGATFTLGNQMLPLAADNSSGSAGNHQYNFGNAPFSISSGNADANGYGNFEYAPPSGYYSLCTKNLGEYG